MHSTPHSEILAPGLAARLTAPTFASFLPELTRFGVGLALSMLYGLALGARQGGLELVRHALGAPLCLVLVGALLLPSLAVSFALIDVPVTLRQTCSAIARSVSSMGLALAGMAPAAALFVVTAGSDQLVVGVARTGCALAGALAIVQLLDASQTAVAGAPSPVRSKAAALTLGYAVFLVLLASRLCTLLLPMLGGAS